MKIKSIKLAGLVSAAIAIPAIYAAPAMADNDAVYSRQDSNNHHVRSQVDEMKSRHSMRRTSDTLDRLLAWNEVMNDANALDHTPSSGFAGDQQGPTRNSRAFAIVSIAVFDATNAFNNRFTSYNGIASAPNGASRDAAIAQAAYTTLRSLYPKQGVRLDQIFSSDLSSINGSGASIAAGRAVGLAAANAMLANRVGDGSVHPEPAFGTGGVVSGGSTATVRAGQLVNGGQTSAPNWTPDPAGTPRGVALGARWGNVKTFALTSGNQFRIPAYPTPGTPRYAVAFNDVATVGADPSVAGSTSTAATRFIGNFWGYDGAPLLGTPPRLYNQIAVKIANNEGVRSVSEYARILAIVNSTMGDSGIAAWDSKYYHNHWRPVTGVRRAAEDGDANTTAIAGWRPFGASVVNAAVSEAFTPPFPAYPSGHATFGAAMFQTLTASFGNNTRFTFVSDEYNGTGVDPKGDARPLVPVRYRTLLEAQRENGRSRVYNGVHWEPDDTEGQNLGTNVANFTIATKFRRVH